jgi:linoleoyl-CoA desaturase
MNSHNVVHHTWTNVVGRDLDVGYGIMRVTTLQRWSAKYLLQPVYFLLLMLLFQEGVALHEQAITDLAEGRGDPRELRPLLRHIGRKAWGQVRKDYIMWPGLGAVVAFLIQLAPIPASVLNPASPWEIFLMVAAANAAANLIRNVWAFIIIFCGHFPSGVFAFTEDQVQGETRGEWYLRQMLGSANISGGRFFHLMSGNLSHQIEHHLFPDLCSNRYAEVAPRVRAVADRYGLPYATGRLSRQFGSTWWNNLRLAFPGGPAQPEVAVAGS